MKIIHCADLHLDSQMTANLTKEQARERKREIIRTFTRMVEYAEKTGVRLIMISGDLFDTRNVSALARNTVRDCTHPQIDFLYLRGNHDSDNFLSKLEEVPDNLLLFSDTWTAYRYGNIVISGIELSENNRATVYNSLVLGHEDFNIVMMHGQAGDYACRTQAENISLNQLKNKNIDYLALGHVHTFMQDKLDNRGTWCYCGCLEGRGFDECGPKGFVLLDVDEQTCRAQMQFVQMAARTLYTLEVDVSNVMTTREAAERMEEAVKQAQYPSGSLVKFVLTGEVELAHKRIYDAMEDYLRQGLRVGMLTIGDPGIYSTYMYMHRCAADAGWEARIVSGVPSFCAVAARLGISLGEKDEEIHIIPAAYDVRESLGFHGTRIYMKSGKKLEELLRVLRESMQDKESRAHQDIYGISNCGMENEQVYCGLDELEQAKGYLTTVIVKEHVVQ